MKPPVSMAPMLLHCLKVHKTMGFDSAALTTKTVWVDI